MPTLRERHLDDVVAKTLPLLQRYARAVTGSTPAGRALVEDMRACFTFSAEGPRPKAQLFIGLQRQWAQNALFAARAVPHEMFLLHRIEGFSIDELSRIFDLSAPYTYQLVSKAEDAARDAPPTRVLILERDALVTIDLCECLDELGYNVVGIARTMPEAALKAKEVLPGVLIADCMLADGHTGAQTALSIAVSVRPMPTVFVDPNDPFGITENEVYQSFSLDVPFFAADVEAVMRQAESLTRYEAAKALL